MKAIELNSKEIAELTGKKHQHIIRDIQTMSGQLYQCPNLDIDNHEGLRVSRYLQGCSKGRIECVYLDRFHTEIVITGYDVKRRAAVIKRMLELEAGMQKIASDEVATIEDAKAIARELVHETMLIKKPRHRIRQYFSDMGIQEATETFLKAMSKNAKATYEDRVRTVQSLRMVVNEHYDSIHARERDKALQCETALKKIAEYERYQARLEASK